MNNSKEHFARIYSEHLWGGESKSGPGSDPQLLRRHLNLLADLIKERRIRSVVDIGCGDWSLAKTIDWSGVSYIGIDIVPQLIDRLNQHYRSNNIRFVCADLVSDRLPDADLCVSKDVLQHLSNASVQRFLSKLDRHFKFALITNDIIHKERAGWRKLWKTTSLPTNYDIPDGGYRPLCLTDKPFNLRASRMAVFPLKFSREVLGTAGAVYETKEVLFWEHTARSDSAASVSKP